MIGGLLMIGGLKADLDHDMVSLERNQHTLTSPIKGFAVSTLTPPLSEQVRPFNIFFLCCDFPFLCLCLI